ncbi:Uncharacterised protein [Mycobacteroides abscessus subsp. abscessus]|nr:Uncharacterised protein [Mycobacteroides abscessus subsp. abscessus]
MVRTARAARVAAPSAPPPNGPKDAQCRSATSESTLSVLETCWSRAAAGPGSPLDPRGARKSTCSRRGRLPIHAGPEFRVSGDADFTRGVDRAGRPWAGALTGERRWSGTGVGGSGGRLGECAAMHPAVTDECGDGDDDGDDRDADPLIDEQGGGTGEGTDEDESDG